MTNFANLNSNTNLQWFPTNAPIASSRTDDIWFIDPMVGWAVNSNGQIIKTTDGGDTWVEQLQDNVYLRCIGFANPLKGWAGTLSRGKRLYSTVDGGQNWKLIENILPELAPSAICGLSVVSESVVYGSGTNYPNRPPRMVRTIDGGATWTAWDMSEYATLLVDNYFIDENRGWVVGGKADSSIANPSRDDVIPVVLYTEDGGKTWVNRVADISDSFPLGEWGWKIQFINESIGFISLENFTRGAILKTTDGGENWVRLPINDPQGNANLEGVGFVDENLGWVGGWGDENFEGGYSSETKNGGENWEDANHIGQFINRFRFFGNPVTVGYASGLTVYKYSTAPVTAALADRVTPLRFLTTNKPAVFKKSVDIKYTLPDNVQKVTIDIWDRFGTYVRKLVDDSNPSAGQKSVVWNCKNDAGESLPPGIFIYRLTVDGNAESRVISLKPQ
ncbi:YCF48-related protein [Mastigocoleus testarum]|uniref:Photosynthesis system II assembly factor Ycf48/Hcf136-like domain-containing protein n=1 Tax=Mastigocoleus testarum BC008 TaxID=371196 RepID=A0A0V7ZY93_9CYAN|nr:YCF48-related protein [Mastigocoleus testarum]KST69498.1 hypothetical protein BC008_04150 [Mastigocoleus testarum BC008]KST69536.1 hypothetical protein BC008_04340 [Mastigocoleus testarum BC008]